MMRTEVDGVPCLAGVVIVDGYKGPAQHCDSDVDYYGYVEIDIYDLQGQPWLDLERRMTYADRARIEMEARRCL